MNSKSNFAIFVAVVAVVIAIWTAFAVRGVLVNPANVGSVGTRFPNGLCVGSTCSVTQNKVTIGNSGTAIGSLVFGSGALIGSDTSQVGSTTKAYDIAVTGVTSSCFVTANLGTTTPAFSNGPWGLDAAKASTTAGYITVLLHNYGAGAIPSVTGVGSTTQYMISC